MNLYQKLPAFIFMFFLANFSTAQDAAKLNHIPNVFLDCNARNCDFNHFRQEITWVNWMRNREDSDVHLLITDQRTGGGGLEYELAFIGLNGFSDINKSLEFISDSNDTDSEVRDKLMNAIALGLVQYIETNPAIVSNMKLVYDAPTKSLENQNHNEINDPWNLWTFRVSAQGEVEGETSEKGYGLDGSISASRTAEDKKISFFVFGRYNHDSFEDIDEGESFVNVSEYYTSRIQSVWSLDPNWSLGGTASVSKSTFSNQDLGVFIGPSIEYNIFPYSMSNRKSVTFLYNVELAYFDYELETIEFKTEETTYRHSLQLRAAIQQPWGEIFGSIEGIQYLNDMSTHRINTFLSLEYRLFKGFSIDIRGSFSRIKDQFYLPAEGLSSEEILLRRRQRETGFRYDVGVGFNYRFGSKYSNVVNTRMTGGRRFG